MIVRGIAAACAAAACLWIACGRDASPSPGGAAATVAGREGANLDASPARDGAALERENKDLRAVIARLEAQAEQDGRAHREALRALESELRRATESRLEREHEWQRFSRGISELAVGTGREVQEFQAAKDGVGNPLASDGAPATEAATAIDANAPSPASEARRRERSQEIARTLRSLFTVEEITGLELFECGELSDGAIGPVVLRLSDAAGRPVGTLCADRLRLEVSRAARTLILVLENGYERRGELRVPFEGAPARGEGAPARGDEGATAEGEDGTAGIARGGVRRLEFPEIDPTPWIKDLPELCGAAAETELVDDGHWDLRDLRAKLNVLLREDVEHGYYSLRGLGGVRGGVIFDVALDQLDRDGRVKCRLFADRLEVAIEGSRVQIVLESGAQVRGEVKTPFLDGRYRIYLPRADAEAWVRAGVPGISPVPTSERP